MKEVGNSTAEYIGIHFAENNLEKTDIKMDEYNVKMNCAQLKRGEDPVT